VIVPAKPKSTRRSETRDLVSPILRALNRLPGVRVVRNANLGPVVPWAKRHDPAAVPILAGLGPGSADLVGIVRVDSGIGRVIALEVKLPALGRLRAGDLRPDQARWIDVFRRLGGHAAVVHSVAEALAAVEACRAGKP
jgi:VRR-NUC domain